MCAKDTTSSLSKKYLDVGANSSEATFLSNFEANLVKELRSYARKRRLACMMINLVGTEVFIDELKQRGEYEKGF